MVCTRFFSFGLVFVFLCLFLSLPLSLMISFDDLWLSFKCFTVNVREFVNLCRSTWLYFDIVFWFDIPLLLWPLLLLLLLLCFDVFCGLIWLANLLACFFLSLVLYFAYTTQSVAKSFFGVHFYSFTQSSSIFHIPPISFLFWHCYSYKLWLERFANVVIVAINLFLVNV